MVENMKEVFKDWMYTGGTTSSSSSYIDHAINILESWLDEKLPNNNIGNLFRFDDYTSYCNELNRITNLAKFSDVNQKDQNGRPKAALNKYKEFLQMKSNTIRL